MNLIGRKQSSARGLHQIAARRFHPGKIVIEEKQINSRSNGSHRFSHVTGALFHGVHIESVRNDHAIKAHLSAEQIAQDLRRERGRQFIRSAIQRWHHDMRRHHQPHLAVHGSAKWKQFDGANPFSSCASRWERRDANRWKYRHVPENVWLSRLLRRFAGRESARRSCAPPTSGLHRKSACQ